MELENSLGHLTLDFILKQYKTIRGFKLYQISKYMIEKVLFSKKIGLLKNKAQ